MFVHFRHRINMWLYNLVYMAYVIVYWIVLVVWQHHLSFSHLLPFFICFAFIPHLLSSFSWAINTQYVTSALTKTCNGHQGTTVQLSTAQQPVESLTIIFLNLEYLLTDSFHQCIYYYSNSYSNSSLSICYTSTSFEDITHIWNSSTWA